MQVRKRHIIPYVFIAIACCVALFFFFQAQTARQELSERQQEIAAYKEEISEEKMLLSADSLMNAGKYSDVIRMYEKQLAQVNSSPGESWEWRVNVARTMLGMQREQGKLMDSLESINAGKDTIDVSNLTSPADDRMYDSLQYALEKANVRINYLNQQLAKQAEGTYLTLKSHQGNTMHYVGEVRNGKANGSGIALLATGSRYMGSWKDNLRHGTGTFYWPDGEYYEGEYRNDKRKGQGTYHWPSGERFVGQWENDQRNGSGKFYNAEGEVVAQGTWKNDELVEVEKE